MQELVERDLAFLQRAQAVLHADVVPGRARGAGRIDAVDVPEIVPVRPTDGRDGGLRLVVLLVRRLAEMRIHRERRQAAPPRDALRRADRRAEAERGFQRRERIVHPGEAFFGVEPDEPAAVLGGAPLRVGPIRGVHVVLEQLAVPDVDRLRDHVGIRLHRQQRIEHARQILVDHVLRDGAAGAAEPHRVGRHAVALDEALLGHHRRFARDLQIVVGAGVVAARMGDRIPETQDVRIQRAAVHGALRMADRHAALEPVEQASVPKAEIRR